MKYILVSITLLSQIFLFAQSNTEKVNKLLQRKTELERSISYYQKELKEVEEKIFKLKSTPVATTIVSESGQKIVATVGGNGATLRLSPSAQGAEVIKIPAKTVVKFRLAKAAKDAVL